MKEDTYLISNLFRIPLLQLRSGQDMLMEIVRLPPEIDLRNGFVGAKQPISRYSRYGSFQGEWMTIPLDKQFAWEVSESIRDCVQVQVRIVGGC